MKEIPISTENKTHLVDILTPETTVFSMFIPLTKVEDTLCPIPQVFLADLARQAQFFHEKGMRYILATDSNAMSVQQYEQIQKMLHQISVEVLDVSTLPNYIPFDQSFNRYPCSQGKDGVSLYSRIAASSKAEYIDKTKVMLADLAGKSPYENVLVTDFDILIDSPSLQIVNGNNIAFTFSGRHEVPSTSFHTENSMIYVSKHRPQTSNGNDLITQVMERVKTILESPESQNVILPRFSGHCSLAIS